MTEKHPKYARYKLSMKEKRDCQLCGIKGKFVRARTINKYTYHVIHIAVYFPVRVELPLFFLTVISSSVCGIVEDT